MGAQCARLSQSRVTQLAGQGQGQLKCPSTRERLQRDHRALASSLQNRRPPRRQTMPKVTSSQLRMTTGRESLCWGVREQTQTGDCSPQPESWDWARRLEAETGRMPLHPSPTAAADKAGGRGGAGRDGARGIRQGRGTREFRK